ncbi:acetyl-CoA acyltransferase [Cyclonatronum proteinivorum]|uniref:acetyl-CoA C-acyltransferase n=1 Tax=Cyclonatronum proteinivorum TaxID=1457365 RepID=A0A345UL98_9BACT|nr:acetyl-CoA acyltransferase [Cyclonatronum proteinivorum]
MMTKEAVLVSSVRTAVGKAKKGSLRHTRPEALGAAAVKGSLDKIAGLDPAEVDDVLIGCAMPEGEQGLNMARVIALRAGLPQSVPAATINRFCSSGLQTIAQGVQAVMAGHAEVVIAGGAESMTLVPMSGYHFSPDPYMAEHHPNIYVGMGITAENVALKYKISREDQDEFAYHSHRKATQALADGVFKDEIIPVETSLSGMKDGRPASQSIVFDTDEGPRADTSPEALAKLRPAFNPRGTVTAGNASQMSDGAAATVVMSAEKAAAIGAKPIARLAAYAVAGVAPEIMGIGPIEAIPKALKQAGLKLSDIGLIELNEAFASQSLAIVRELGIDPEIVNVYGGAIALGHPLGCTGAKLTATLLHAMKRKKVRYGMCTMCIGGGMGAAGIFELID